jgi:hypothetical protein
MSTTNNTSGHVQDEALNRVLGITTALTKQMPGSVPTD